MVAKMGHCQFLAIRIDAGKNPGKDLVGQLVAAFPSDREAPRAESWQCQSAQIFSGNLDLSVHDVEYRFVR